MNSLLNSIRIFKELTPMLLKLVHKTEKEETQPNSLYEFTLSISIRANLEKDTTKKLNYRPLFLMNIDAIIHNKLLKNQIQ
jgi:hypothetical protein